MKRTLLLAAGELLAICILASIPAQRVYAQGPVFIVNSPHDEPDSNLSDRTCDTSRTIGDGEVDVLISTVPTTNGERIVLRLLDKQAGRLDLMSLGMDPETERKVDELIHKPHGIILVTGPTGSGKTTTLYAALERINDNSRNIMTVEDLIEYFIDGIGQSQVNTKV